MEILRVILKANIEFCTLAFGLSSVMIDHDVQGKPYCDRGRKEGIGDDRSRETRKIDTIDCHTSPHLNQNIVIISKRSQKH